jgi:hypothetical protein
MNSTDIGVPLSLSVSVWATEPTDPPKSPALRA